MCDVLEWNSVTFRKSKAENQIKQFNFEFPFSVNDNEEQITIGMLVPQSNQKQNGNSNPKSKATYKMKQLTKTELNNWQKKTETQSKAGNRYQFKNSVQIKRYPNRVKVSREIKYPNWEALMMIQHCW